MGLALNEYHLQLVDPNLSDIAVAIDDNTGVCNVLTINSPAVATIYRDQQGTTATNPMTFTNGSIRFWTPDTVTSVDLSILTATGVAVFAEDVTPSMHRIVIDPRRRDQRLILPFKFLAAGTVVDTGFDLPVGCVMNPYQLGVRVTTVDATETLDVGLLASEAGGDEDGFITLAPLGNLGMVNLIPQITNGTNIDYGSTNYVGALLATVIAGADAVATVGGWTPKMNYRTDGVAKSITYTPSTSDTAAGYIYLGYTRMP